ncbi:hypothetical protein GLOIN_2v1687677 [Rhizophagus irregularis DAOM 181602=DAOM 197198]|uniref:Uncharacterized protein n=1 Tax=Rhizophagus irregularis (strain DAOM 181602 / DAOM 197198 / MUCL 43194) TaxID=747089 RepID=A0A2P4PD37_RHIID|nr:hypothetical protein GLOIN_2v1687677 [Rhizophagus irregularis DAOM 181602=DAOM 197198]POG63292.1 hypothetical protein GLOIN_2v1687677 [Rhizophagus irregularis DAOM 181602=DAOM 197198]|eukprot:XP_025170158.1 hypothetical protein GLOIN_2v1687677 [Rhizophagus irregularis DAOM 181602=DAOM 197198]
MFYITNAIFVVNQECCRCMLSLYVFICCLLIMLFVNYAVDYLLVRLFNSFVYSFVRP